MSGTLFPAPPAGFRYFKPKNTQGVLAKFCSDCGSHLDAHAYQWLTGGHGTVRACPPEHHIAPPANSSAAAGDVSIASQQQPLRNSRGVLSSAPRNSHHLHRAQADVDLSLTSSGTVGDRKTVGKAAAHHRFNPTATPSGGNTSGMLLAKSDSGSLDPRSTTGLPQPQGHPRDDLEYGNNDEEYAMQQQQQQQPGASRFQLYDDDYTTPVPFGTDVDLANPPPVAGPRGRRHNPAMAATTEQVVSFPRASDVRQRMERGNMVGAAGICVASDAVRPDQSRPRCKTTTMRKDAVSTTCGAGAVWE